MALRLSLIRRSIVVVIPISVLVILAAWKIGNVGNFTILCILVPLPILASLSAIYTGFLNAEGNFRLAVMSPIYGSILSVPFLFALPTSAQSLAIILLLFELGRVAGLRLSLPRFVEEIGGEQSALPGNVLSWAIRGAGFQALGSFMVAMNPLIDIFFAKLLGSGAISSVEYANRLWNIVPLFFTGTLMLLHSRWSHSAVHSTPDVGEVHKKAIRIGIIAGGISMMLISVSGPIVNLLYGFGSMSEGGRDTLAWLLAAYLLGASPFIVGLIYVRALSVQGDMHVLATVAAVGVICNAVGDFVLMQYLGVIGIGLATTITYTFVTLLLWRNFNIRYQGIGPR
jgi:putative peptidoglycan lipid II flippase